MTLNHDQTPRISWHALERCRQMGVSTKVPKHIWRNPSVTAPGNTPGSDDRDRVRVKSDAHPEYLIVVDVSESTPVVVTVLFNLHEPYVRCGTTYETIQEN